jgi:hypothetical protein
MKYRPVAIPRNPKMRDLVQIIDYLQEQLSRDTKEPVRHSPLVTGPGTPTHKTTSSSGPFNSLPSAHPGEFSVVRGKVGLNNRRGNLKLDADYQGRTDDSTILLSSDGRDYHEIGGRGRGTFVPVSDWGVHPNTGQDQTARIQRALAECPIGSTLVFPPGTYLVSAQLVCSTPINIYGLQATLDWGTSWDAKGTWAFPTLATPAAADAAFVYGYAPAAGQDPFQRTSITGLRLKRTVTGVQQAANYHGAGIRFYCLYSCEIRDIETEGFGVGQWYSGGVNAGRENGCVHNTTIDAVYRKFSTGLLLDPGDSGGGLSGWCGENTFINCRNVLEPQVQADANAIVGAYLRFAATDHHEVNGNRFIGHVTEGGATYYGRKVYCEGRSNFWIFCRWEDTVVHSATDITFIDSGSAGGTNNVLQGGFDLNKMNVVGLATLMYNQRFDSVLSDFGLNHTIKSRSALLGDTASGIYSQSRAIGNGITAPWTLVNTSSPGPFINGLAVNKNNELDIALALRESADNSIILGSLCGYKTVSMTADSTTDTFTSAAHGMVADNRVLVRSTGVLPSAPALPGGILSATVRYFLVNVAANTFQLSTSSGGAAIDITTNGTGTLFVTAERNWIGMVSASPYPWATLRGLIVNRQDAASNDFVVLNGAGTATPLLTADTTSQYVLVGASPTATNAKFEVKGNVAIEATSSSALVVESGGVQMVRIDTDDSTAYFATARVVVDGGNLELRGALGIDRNVYAGNHTLTATECYIVFTANAALTLTTAATLSGRILIVKAKSGATVTISPAGGETIDGAASLTLLPNESRTLIADGAADWDVN